jgi:hypothetical protein
MQNEALDSAQTGSGKRAWCYPLDMSDALVIDGHALESEADNAIATLGEVCAVALIDLDENKSHMRMSSGWFSYNATTEDAAATVETRSPTHHSLCIPINRRWILRVAGLGKRIADDGWIVTYAKAPPMSIEQEALAANTARLLARLLPSASRLTEVLPPDGTGSGGSGSAELGIPVWWARKARS